MGRFPPRTARCAHSPASSGLVEWASPTVRCTRYSFWWAWPTLQLLQKLRLSPFLSPFPRSQPLESDEPFWRRRLSESMGWWLVFLICDQASIFVMGPNPNPYEILSICDSQCSVVNSYPGRPELANFFKMKRRMGRIDLKEFEILFRQLLNRFR